MAEAEAEALVFFFLFEGERCRTKRKQTRPRLSNSRSSQLALMFCDAPLLQGEILENQWLSRLGGPRNPAMRAKACFLSLTPQRLHRQWALHKLHAVPVICAPVVVPDCWAVAPVPGLPVVLG